MNDAIYWPRRWIVLVSIIAIVAVALELRLQAALETDVNGRLRADAGDYFMSAYNLRLHGVYTSSRASLADAGAKLVPDAVRTPGYPLFLAIFVDGRLTTSMYYEILIIGKYTYPGIPITITINYHNGSICIRLGVRMELVDNHVSQIVKGRG